MSKSRIYQVLPVGLMAAFLFIAIILLNSVAQAAPGTAPLLDDPTPTPTVIAYWEANSQSYTWSQGDGAVYCLPAGGYLIDADGDGDCNDLYAPEDNSPGGILVKLNSASYDGDAQLRERSNSDWVQKFTDAGWGHPTMTVGETICVGTSGACSSAGYSVDPDSDWEGYVSGDPYDYIEDVRLEASLGYSGGVSFSITPIYYGVVLDPDGLFCRELTPDNTDELKTGTLLGTDEVGAVIEDLITGEEYLLFTEDGPWNDGADDRYDIAIRFFDGAAWGEWMEPSEFSNEDADPKDVCDDDFLDSEDNQALTFVATDETQSIQLRVNDEDGEFTDNSESINYVFSTAAPGYGQGCDNYWQLNDEIFSVTIDATDNTWQYFYPSGSWIRDNVYGLVIDGTYTDNGSTENDIAVSNYPDSAGSSQRDYPDYNLWTGSDTCDLETDDYKEYYGNSRLTFYDNSYTFGFGGVRPLARVEDNDSNFTNNAGTIDATIYGAQYDAPPSDCATTYDKGTYLETISVPALSSNGIYFPQILPKLEENQIYYIEPIEPYLYGGDTRSFSFEIRPNAVALGGWQDDDYYADCVTQVDHERYGYYFRTDIDLLPSLNDYDIGDFMWIRTEAAGGIYADNVGTLQLELYGAETNVVPEDEDCSDYYNLSQLVYTDTFAADSSAGYSIDHSVFEPGEIYRIVVDDTYDIRRSFAGSGAVDYEFYMFWDAGLCHDLEDGEYALYFEAQALSDYEIRNHQYDTETGTNTFKVYTTSTLKEPMTGCEYRNYSDIDDWYLVVNQEDVLANNSGTGDDLQSAYLLANDLSSDSIYKIVTSGGPWTSSGAPFAGYDLDISTNGGSTWQALTDWLDCVVEVEDHIRGYKTGPTEEGPFLLRVQDPEELWVNNNGKITIDFYTDTRDDEANDTRYDPAIDGPEGYSYGCTAECIKPGSWINAGEWVEYARCRTVAFFAWCPWHTEDLNDLKAQFLGIEPFTTILELIDLGRVVQAEVDTYTWVDDGGGDDTPQVQAPANYVFAPGEGGGAEIPIVGEDSIWGSGEITLTGNTGISYSTECDNVLADSLGTRLAAPMCFVFNIVDQLGLLTWVQLLWDLAMLFVLFWYIKRNWIDLNQ